jgi:cation transport regulator ChaC
MSLAFSFLGFIAICLLLAGPSEQKSVPAPAPTGDCHPVPNAQSSQYIIGYGSLMQNASKSRTDPNTGESIPIIVHGFSRRWNAQGSSVGYSTTFLGVAVDPPSSFNAIVYQLNSADVPKTMKSYDDRESWYCRVKVDFSQIDFVKSGAATDANGEYWIYINKPEFTAKPNNDYPIVQSYVDIFISGCLEVEDKYGLTGFAASCIDSTADWDKSWVNDRIYPRRPFLYEPKASRIDKILAAQVPKQYKSIKIEG